MDEDVNIIKLLLTALEKANAIEYLNEDTFEILESSELKNCQMVKNIKFLFQLYL